LTIKYRMKGRFIMTEVCDPDTHARAPATPPSDSL